MERKAVSGTMLILLVISMLTLAFNIQPVRAGGTIYIRPDGSVEGTDKIQRDGDIYKFTDSIYDSIVVEKDNVIVDGNGYTLQGTGTGNGFYLQGRTNVTMRNVRIIHFYTGVYLVFSTGSTIAENNVSSNSQGINLYQSTGNNVSSNTVTSNQGGITVYQGSDYTTVERNTVESNAVTGIDLGMANWCTVASNNLTNNLVGVWLDHSSNNTFLDNSIKNSVLAMRLNDSPENTIYHNNFINNTNQAYIVEESLNNAWDNGYPSGGNYWSDYSSRYPDAQELDDAGIWDTPYSIDENNQDRYPLMNPWRERTVGVKVGDWAKYTADTSWTGVLDPRLEMLSETEWGMIEVTDVQGTVVTFVGTSHFKNGSDLTTPGAKWDIAPTGSFGFIFWFISSNLQAGDKVYPSGAMTINETVTQTYCGVPRENNHQNWSTSFSIIPGPPYDLTEFDCYWDQATGILTEESLEASAEDLSNGLSMHIKMVDTNLWEAPIPTTVGELKTKTDEFGSEGEIDNQGIVKSLIAKLNGAQKLVDKGKVDEAKMVLEDFIIQVQELSGIHITIEAADILIKSAEYIIAYL